MQNLTLDDISTAILFLVALIGGIAYLHKSLKTFISDLLKEEFKTIRDDIQGLRKDLKVVDMENCKNFIVRFLADVERGDYIADAEIQRFWEEYEHYISKGGNSYIKEWVAKLKKEGKL